MKPYYELPVQSIIVPQLLELIQNNDKWIEYFSFPAMPISYEILFQDTFFKRLFERHRFVPGILKMEPFKCYDWHVDANRGVGINQLLTPDTRSFCVFAPQRGKLNFPIEELRYKPSTYYLFNTQVEHTVYNFDETRYLLSIEFEKDKNALSFSDLINDLESSPII